MIHILVGNDYKKRSAYIKSLIKDCQRIDLNDASKEVLYDYATSTSLFGDSPAIFLENIITENSIDLDTNTLIILRDSPTHFIFLEDKLLKKDEAKYKKYTIIESFEIKTLKKIPEFNTFAIADSYGKKDKINTWVLYREAIEKGIEPEAISGVIFWKIKTMILNKTKIFNLNDLKNQSKNIVSLYHRAHKGECDFVIGLEQFILTSLSK